MNKTFETVTRVTITGPQAELASARYWCKENEFNILRQGPVPVMDDDKQVLDEEGHPKYDNTQFKIFAETKASY